MTDARQQYGTVRNQLKTALKDELETGERIKWQGMKLARVEPAGFGIYIFAVPWTAFALFWMAMAAWISPSGPDAGILESAFPLFGIPFVLIGVGMLARPFLPFLQRGRILFAVTDSRVIKLSQGRQLTVNSVPWSRIGDIVRRESSDGTGSVDLTLSTTMIDYHGQRSSMMIVGRVDDVRGAYEAILALSNKT